MKKIIIGLVILTVFLITSLVFLSCNTFKPVRYKNVPEEVNIMYSTMRLYKDAKDKTTVAITIEKCYKTLHRQRCKKEIYGDDKIDYSNHKKYRSYNECLKELR